MSCERALRAASSALCSCFVPSDCLRTPPWLAVPQPSNARRRRCPPRRRRGRPVRRHLVRRHLVRHLVGGHLAGPLASARRPAAIDLAAPVDGDVAVEDDPPPRPGRAVNASGRYEPLARVAFDDGWQSLEDLPPFKTTVTVDATRKIITRNDSPDISFDRSINPYRGCEHGCIYCFARPTHAYLGLSPGLDFESKLFAKPDAAKLLERELSAPGYVPRTIAIGTNTDPYQPIETRASDHAPHPRSAGRDGHPVGIVTKSALVLRDIDILSRMAKRKLVKVALSVTTLDRASWRASWSRAPRRRPGGSRRCGS